MRVSPGTPGANTVLEAINLKKTYGDYNALKGLNLTINPGDIYCLLGANGADKTTMINLFLNFIDPTAGTAKVCGIDVTDQPLETPNQHHARRPPHPDTQYRRSLSCGHRKNLPGTHAW
jgi:ABC-type branched-subunit amino acid transport system ATPase component